jgi:hypothetical protein
MGIHDLTQVYILVLLIGYFVPDKFMKPGNADTAAALVMVRVKIRNVKKVIPVEENPNSGQFVLVVRHLVTDYL